MRNSETQRKPLSATISPSEALNQALIDEKGYFNHQKLKKKNGKIDKRVNLQII